MLGALSLIASAGQRPMAPTFFDRISFTGDNAYPTGGTAGFKALVEAKTKDSRQPIAVITNTVSGATKYTLHYDVVNDKLQVFNAAAEVANATDLSGVTFEIVAISY